MNDSGPGERFIMNQAPRSQTVSVQLFPFPQPDPSIPVVLDADSSDPVESGMLHLNHIGYPRHEVIAAAAGYSKNHEPQVLVLGQSYIAIVDSIGETILEAGIREIRGLRRVTGQGLEIWLTSIPIDGGIRETPFIHMLPDSDAKYLEETWLKSSPSMHNGVQINRKPWREEEYAHFVGRVIMEAARCEAAISSLLIQLKTLGADVRTNDIGASGKQLVTALMKVGQSSAAMMDIIERYGAWSGSRDFVAHGFRVTDEAGNPTSTVYKTRRKSQSHETMFEATDQDFDYLALIWWAYYALTYDVQSIALQMSKQGNLEEMLRDLPMPSTVNDSERLPPQ